LRVIARKIVREGKPMKLNLVALGDLHVGHRNVDYDLLERVIDTIKDMPDCLWIGMGDWADCIVFRDKRFDLNAVDPTCMTPDRQYRRVKELLEPIKDKCIGLLDGNHDYLFWRRYQHNYVDSLAYQLGVPYLTMDASSSANPANTLKRDNSTFTRITAGQARARLEAESTASKTSRKYSPTSTSTSWAILIYLGRRRRKSSSLSTSISTWLSMLNASCSPAVSFAATCPTPSATSKPKP